MGVDNEQTLNNLLDIFTLDTLNNVVAWLSVYWYVPVIVVVVIIILMILLHVTYRKRRPLKRRLSRARNSLRRGRGGAPDAVDADNRGGHRRPGPQRLSQSETSSSFVASPRAVDLNPETLHQKATSYWDIPSDWVFVSIMLRFHVIFLKHGWHMRLSIKACVIHGHFVMEGSFTPELQAPSPSLDVVHNAPFKNRIGVRVSQERLK